MKFSHMARFSAALDLAILLLCSTPAPAFAAGVRSADVAAALSQVGPEEYSNLANDTAWPIPTGATCSSPGAP